MYQYSMKPLSDLFSLLDKHAGAIQALSAVAIVILTVLLVLATLRYARATGSALSISRDQFTEMMRVEVLLMLHIVRRTMSDFDAQIDLANLSNRGIWWEKFSVTTTVLSFAREGKQEERLVRKVVPRYVVESVSITESIYQSYLTTGLTDETAIGHVKVVATYRVDGKCFTKQFESPKMVMKPNSASLATELDKPAGKY
jgi:hypothetical protein